MPTERLEAFSDAVFAIAITLLVLEIPKPTGDDLAHELRELWPYYATYAVSFFTIGIIWVNHHFQYDRTTEVTRPLMYINLFLLMIVAFIPFPTGILPEHLHGDEGHVAAAFYAGTLLLMSLSFFAMSEYIRTRRLTDARLTPALLRALRKRGRVGGIAYLVAIGIAFVSAPASLAICAATAVYYIFPGREVARLRDQADRAAADTVAD